LCADNTVLIFRSLFLSCACLPYWNCSLELELVILSVDNVTAAQSIFIDTTLMLCAINKIFPRAVVFFFSQSVLIFCSNFYIIMSSFDTVSVLSGSAGLAARCCWYMFTYINLMCQRLMSVWKCYCWGNSFCIQTF